MHVIDYGHVRGSVLYHGTVSDLDGVPKSTWAWEQDGREITQEQPIDQDTFRFLWNGVASLDVFRRNGILDPDRKLDPVSHHVIGIVFQKGPEPTHRCFLVPAEESDPEFLGWLEALNVPAGAGANKQPRVVASSGEPRTRRLDAVREKVYRECFGDNWTVNRDSPSQGPAIDVYVFEPGTQKSGRDFYTLVTGGMSDYPMKVPDGASFRRAELILYVDQPTEQHVNLLRWLGQLPHVQEGTWYMPGTTMTNGQPPQPIFDGSELDCFLFSMSIVSADAAIQEKLVLEGDPTIMLWVVPITHPECRFILKRTLDEFFQVLDKKAHPFVLDERRCSYIRPKR
jgi:hypothetical protein